MKYLAWTTLLVGGIAACGARTTLEGNDGGSAGTSTAPNGGRRASTQTIGTSTSSGAPIGCGALQLVDPVVIADTQGPAQAPQITTLPGGDALLTWLRGDTLEMSAIPAFTTWPTGLAAVVPMVAGVSSFTLGPRAGGGTTANITFYDGSIWFADELWPNLIAYGTGGVEPVTSLFAARLEQTWLFGLRSDFGGVSIDSYGPASVLQQEYPYVCSSRPLAAAVPVSGGLLGVYAELYGIDFCDLGKAWPDAIVTTRYELTPSFDDPLQPSLRTTFLSSEPLFDLTMAPASFGAWVVYQTDGSTSRSAPPVSALRVGHDASLLEEDAVLVSPTGFGVGPIAAASIGDALVVAYTNDGPSIVVQRVEANRGLGSSVTVPTGIAPRAGKLRLVASPGGDKLLLGWEAAGGALGLARIDCADAP